MLAQCFGYTKSGSEQADDTSTEPRLTSDIIPLARLFTAPAINVPNDATDSEHPFDEPGDLLDASAFTIEAAGTGQQWVFELDCGY